MHRYNLRSRTRNGMQQKQHDSVTAVNAPVQSISKACSKPTMSELNKQVQAVVSKATWWDLYGVDWCLIFSGFALVPPGLLLLRSNDWGSFLVGLFLLGLTHGMIKTKTSHLAAHGALCHSKTWNKFWQILFIEFFGSFSSVFSLDTHLKIHHPYTNIIGLGDSSTWRVPFLPCLIYMFLAPMALPPLTPVIAIGSLLYHKKFVAALKCFVVISCGLVANVLLLMWASYLSGLKAVACILAYRAPMEIPYIHTNIFQHIGLPMYAQNHHPQRVELMSNGALNIQSTPLLTWNFGHSLIDCHVEHHMFPNLSDNMCIKVKPLVRDYILKHGLPYHEVSYWDRLKLFVKKYEELMVNAPSITEFIGLQ